MATAAPLPSADPPYLAGLNAPQRQAVLTVDGPVLMLAGAGTGKTKALTARLAHIIATGRAYPGQILAVTFTNKAAREMQHRVGGLIGGAVEGMPWLGTFHAVAARMLRRHAELVGLKSSFAILDTDDQLRLMKQLVAAENLDEKRWPARMLAAAIDKWKNRGLRPDQLSAADGHVFGEGKAVALYAAYQDRLRTLNACDFGDLLLHLLTIFTQHRDVLAEWQRRFRYILVDEYQDTNVCQYLWLRLLAQRPEGPSASNLCCVGDDDQSIYGWRGAEVGNILKFEQDFPGAAVIRLEQNYRSGPHILAAASALIASNAGRLGKTLWTEQGVGEKVSVISVWDGAEEARVVGERIEQAQGLGLRLAQMAVLVRAGFQTREFEDRFLTLGLPYRIVGGMRFYERQEVRDALAYLRLLVSAEDDLAFERIANVPKRGLGDTSLKRLHSAARAQSWPLERTALALVQSDELSGPARRGLAGLVQDLARWRTLMGHTPHPELARIVLEESGYVAMWQLDKSAEAAGRLENLNELIRAMEEFETLTGFLEHVALVMDNDATDTTEKVTVMTLHAAKGLEFDWVFLAGWEDGLFPSQRSLDENGQAGLEEERRLAYVGLTRARHKATVLHAANRRVYGQWQSSIPSRFLEELPAGHTETESRLTGGNAAWRTGYDAYDPFAGIARSAGRGPGWERAQARGGFGGSVRPPVIDGQAQRLTTSSTTVSAFRPNDRVFHDKFGAGSVLRVDGNKLEIAFDRAGTKHVVDSFVRPL
jgi:DNA helicase-2/ATP-dependent DNA helicase PcrA